MPVHENVASKEDINAEIAAVEKKKADAMRAIMPSLDLPDGDNVEDELNKIRTEEQKKFKIDRAEREARKSGSEVSLKEEEKKEEEPEQVKEKKEAEEPEDEGDDELIPKSKVEKRFKQLTEQIKELKAERAQKDTAPVSRDPDREKLENMTPDQLKETLKTVRALQLKIATGAVEGNIDDYTELEMKVHEAMSTYPMRFQNDQVISLNKAIAATEYDEDIIDAKAAIPEIRKIAEKLYADHDHFKYSKTGMKAAWDLALEHYKIIQDKNMTKDDQERIKRENTKMKKKTSLDSSKNKGSELGNRKLDLLRKRIAGGGTDQDRSDFVKESPLFRVNELLPDEWKDR